MRRLLAPLVALAVPAGALVPVALAWHGHRVYVPNGGVATRSYRPHTIVISGDSSYYVTHIRWSSYNGAVARGRGTSNVDNCLPTCAQGHIYRDAVRIRLTRPHRKCGRYYYGTIHLYWPRRRPPHFGRHDTRSIGPFGCGG